MLEQRLSEILGGIEPETPLHVAAALQLREELRLALDAEASEAVQLTRGRFLEIRHGMDFEFVIEGASLFRSDAWHVGELNDPSRQAVLRRIQDREMPGLNEFGVQWATALPWL